MKFKNIYVAASSQHVGKTTSTLGLVAACKKRGYKVGYCKPVGQKFLNIQNLIVDKDTVLFADLIDFDLQPDIHSPVILGTGSTSMILDNAETVDLDSEILYAKEELSKNYDIVIYEGTGHPGVGSIANLSNARVAKLVDAGVIMVVEGGIGSTIDMLNMCTALFREEGVPIIGVIINKVKVEKMEKVKKYLSIWLKKKKIPLLGCIPYDQSLAFPLMRSVADAINAKIIAHDEMLDTNVVENILAGSLVDLKELKTFQNLLLVTSYRTADSAISKVISFSNLIDIEHTPLAGIVLTGEGEVSEKTMRYINNFKIPLMETTFDTYGVTLMISRIEVKINRSTPWKVNRAIELIEENVDMNQILELSK